MNSIRPLRYLLQLFTGILLLCSSTGAMELGTNFWNLKWHKPDDCFQDVKNVSGEDPWNPQFLKEIRIYRCLRFMDWDYTNGSPRQKWSERPQKTAHDQSVAAYEWMIDLCNRNNSDMWVCIPHLTINRDSGDEPCDYALRLCLLVKTGVDVKDVDLKPLMEHLSAMTDEELIQAGGIRTGKPLDPSHKLYLEYSNETWNGGFKQSHYCVEEGTALNLDPRAPVGNDGKKWNNGFRFHAWAALRIFRAADLVFGAGSPRVVRTFAQQTSGTFQTMQHITVMNDATMNPWHVKADATALAPYFGLKVAGDDPEAPKALRYAMMEVLSKVEDVKKAADSAHLKLIAYEGGQHVLKKASVINRDPVMFDLYTDYLDNMSRYFVVFCHYAHVGRAGDGGAWGCIEHTGQALSEAPKYRALVEWTKIHSSENAGSSSTDSSPMQTPPAPAR